MAKKGHNDINRNLLLLLFFFPLLFLKARKEGMCKTRHRGTLLPPSPSPLHSDKAVTQGEEPSSLLLLCTDIPTAVQTLPNSGLSFFQGDPNKAQPVGPHVAAVILTSFTWSDQCVSGAWVTSENPPPDNQKGKMEWELGKWMKRVSTVTHGFS